MEENSNERCSQVCKQCACLVESTSKAFIDGYRNTRDGLLYHHACTQEAWGQMQLTTCISIATQTVSESSQCKHALTPPLSALDQVGLRIVPGAKFCSHQVRACKLSSFPVRFRLSATTPAACQRCTLHSTPCSRNEAHGGCPTPHCDFCLQATMKPPRSCWPGAAAGREGVAGPAEVRGDPSSQAGPGGVCRTPPCPAAAGAGGAQAGRDREAHAASDGCRLEHPAQRAGRLVEAGEGQGSRWGMRRRAPSKRH